MRVSGAQSDAAPVLLSEYKHTGCSLLSLGCPCCLDAKTHYPMTPAQIYPAVKLRIRDVGCHELLGQLSLVCLVCSLRIL